MATLEGGPPVSSGLDDAFLASGKVSLDDLRKVRRFSAEKGERIERMLVELGCHTAASLLPSVVSWRSAESRTSRGSSAVAWPAPTENGNHSGTALVTSARTMF